MASDESAKARQEAAEAKKTAGPRSITNEQFQILHNEFEKIFPFAFKEQNGFIVAGTEFNGESIQYAKQIFEAIKTPKLEKDMGFFYGNLNPIMGISIFYNQSGPKSICCQMVEDAFTKAGIKFIQQKFAPGTIDSRTTEEKIVYIVVGTK